MKKNLIPVLLFSISLLWVGHALMPHTQPAHPEAYQFAQKPLLEGGRIKPIDSFARSTLLMLSGKQTAKTPEGKIPAYVWLHKTIQNPVQTQNVPIFEINDPDVMGLMNLKQSRKRVFSFAELRPYLAVIEDQAQSAAALDAKDRSRFQGAVLVLFNKLHLFLNIPTVLDQADASLQTRRVTFEFLFNQAAPFYKSIVLYLLAFVLICLSWLFSSRKLSNASFSLVTASCLIHTFGIIARMIIQGRPPVTNLYSSAIFVGWVSVLLGLILEKFQRRGFGSASASIIGIITLIIAHHLSQQGDTLEMMRAVLDSNYWLATHVITITIGYSSTFIAGVLASIYLLRRRWDRGWNNAAARALFSMIYGVVCFSLLFSFVGTVLGGIWADQSWGRFWGWDPKENGALMIVLWNAFFLHAHWSKLFGETALVVMAVFGNVITALSWFGVNMLGIGLHSYGFMDEALFWLVVVIISQLCIMGLGGLAPGVRRQR